MRHEFKETDDFVDTMRFGEVMRKVRRLIGVNQVDFAEWIGLNKRTVSDYEVGKSSPPIEYSRELLKKMGFEIRIIRVNKEAINDYNDQGF